MATSILQVRDLPEDVVAKLRERAAGRGISLSAYVRDVLTHDAEQETTAEAIARIESRTPVEVEDEDVLSGMHEKRR